MAVVWIGLQLALAGQFRSDSSVRAAKTLFDLQTSAQLLGEEEPGVCNMHWPLAVVPAGTISLPRAMFCESFPPASI